MMQWWPVDTPDSLTQVTGNLYSPVVAGAETGSELIKLLIGVNGSTMYMIYSAGDFTGISKVRLSSSANGGRSWSGALYGSLCAATGFGTNDTIVWDACLAPDNANMLAVAVSDVNAIAVPVQRVFITSDGGQNWDNTQWAPAAPHAVLADSYISTMDLSMDYGGRDLLVGTRNGSGVQVNNLWTLKMPGYGGWLCQNVTVPAPGSTNSRNGDVIAAKFSPTYNGDSTIVVLYSNTVGTYLISGVHDLARNITTWQPLGSEIEIRNASGTGSAAGDSPRVTEIITGMLQLPSDFSGQSASLRRVYVSTDAITRASVAPATNIPTRGVYRIDDTTVYTLMDNSSTFRLDTANLSNRRAASIAYWGTYASGKLLVGERLGQTCTATVPVWFTDSPTVCPIPCWYPAKKPPTGAAGETVCWPGMTNFGNAYVVWAPTYASQGVAYAVTGSMSYDGPYAAFTTDTAALTWPSAIFAINPLDESAMSLTRNNGETWNQLSLIDTLIIKLTDVAPAADCTTIYLASVNNGIQCEGFDSVWRSSQNEKVVMPPLPSLPIGQIWERVMTRVTGRSCNNVQSNYAILRLAPDKLDGQIVGWAAGGTSNLTMIGGLAVYEPTSAVGPGGTGGQATPTMAWSPDFGDYWADITPRIQVQDFAFESSTILYVLGRNGTVQKMPYTGTAWASSLNTVSTKGTTGHTIEAMAPDKVLVGQAAAATNTSVMSLSTDGATNFGTMGRMPGGRVPSVGYHVLFDTDFTKNAIVYIASDLGATVSTSTAGSGNNADISMPPEGLVYRNTAPAGSNTEWTDMMTGGFFIGYAGPHEGYYGLVQTNSKNVIGQGTLYAAHTIQGINATAAAYPPTTPPPPPDGIGTLNSYYSGVERTLSPLDGIPKPNLEWSCLDAARTTFQRLHPIFTLEPKSLKICGCLTQDTNASLYAIDNDIYSDNHNRAALRNDRFGFDIPGVATTGLLWEYTDCVAKKGPKLILDDGAIIGCDPATGRNQEVNFRWEQLCIATIYQLQIAKDKAFTLGVFDSGSPYGAYVAPVAGLAASGGRGIQPVDVTAPAFVFFAGGEGAMPGNPTALVSQELLAATFSTPALECGHSYFWRTRVLDETTRDAVNSPWSEVRGFNIKAGFRVTTPYYGPQLLAPDNGCGCACNAPIAFSWSPFKETTEYQFTLSENADMSSPLVSTAVKTTAYQFTGTVKCNKTYFWRVQANKPAPSEWSAVFSFNTQPEPPKPPAPAPEPGTPMWVWVIIAIGAILVIVTLVLIFKTRRV
jgi:hypothetical protein